MGWESYVREALSTAHMLTLVRLFTRVSPYMDCQSTALNETLAASHNCTRVWSFIGVYSEVSLQVGLAIKALLGALVL